MKKTLVFLVLFISLAIPLGDAFGAPTGGVHMPERNTFDLGFEVNIIRDFRTKDNPQAVLRSEGSFLCLSYGVLDWLAVDFKFGFGSIRNDIYEGPKYDYDAKWAGAYGFRWQLYKNERYGIKIITGIQHMSIHPKKNEFNGKRYAVLDDSQAEVLVSKLWKNFDFYSGAKTSISRYIRQFDDTSETKSMDQGVTAVIGAEYYFKENTRLQFEARFLEENAFTLGIRYQF